jgi:hypothetical protein
MISAALQRHIKCSSYMQFYSKPHEYNRVRASPRNDIKAPQNLVYRRNLDFINQTEPYSSPAIIRVPETRSGVPQICGSRFLPLVVTSDMQSKKKILATCTKWASDLDKMGLGFLKAGLVSFSVSILSELLE